MRHRHSMALASALLPVLVLVLLVSAARPAGTASGLIAFTRAGAIYVMRSDGSDVHAVWRRGFATSVAWSPDGTKLAFGESGLWKPGPLMVMNADGSRPVRVASGPAHTLTWSPDGRRIAFTSGRSAQPSDIWVVNVDGSNLHRITRTPQVWEREVDWSPDGGRLAFDSASWLPHLYVMRTDGSARRDLTRTQEWCAWSEQPDWSPEGGRLLFVYAKPFGARCALGPPNCDIWVMNADGTARVRLTDNKVYDGSPDWSPDGRRIAFVRHTRVGVHSIYVMNADGTGVTRLTHSGVNDASPVWQPVAP